MSGLKRVLFFVADAIVLVFCLSLLIQAEQTFFEYLHLGIPFFVIIAFLLIGLGVSQLLRNKPVGGGILGKPPKIETIRDWKEWNKKHGVAWISYGVLTIGSFLLLTLCNEYWIAAFAHTVICVGGLALYVVYDNRLEKKYLIEEE